MKYAEAVPSVKRRLPEARTFRPSVSSRKCRFVVRYPRSELECPAVKEGIIQISEALTMPAAPPSATQAAVARLWTGGDAPRAAGGRGDGVPSPTAT